MPELSRFYGIVIVMYYNDHLPAHFHAEYQGKEAQFALPNLEILQGNLPNRAIKLVREWARMHMEELVSNWNRRIEKLPLIPIEPLD